MGIFSWIIFGLITGAMARLLMSADDLGGWLITILVGIAGAILGGFAGNFLGFGGAMELDIRSLLVAIGGSMLVLYGYRRMKRSV